LIGFNFFYLNLKLRLKILKLDFFLPSVLWAQRVSEFEVSFERFFVCAVIIVLI